MNPRGLALCSRRTTGRSSGGLCALALLICGSAVCASEPELTIVSAGSTLHLRSADFAALPREAVDAAHEDGQTARYEGIRLDALLARAGVALNKEHFRNNELTTYVIARARDGYSVVFSLGELAPNLGGERVIIADKLDGKPLDDKEGPFRLVVAGDKRPARSIRMLDRIEITSAAAAQPSGSTPK